MLNGNKASASHGYVRITYNPAGEITKWTQLQNGATTIWDMTAADAYDSDSELHKAVQTTTSGTIPFQWDYDKAGNRTTEFIGTASTTWATNNLNQLTSQNANAVILEGDTNRAVTGVTVNQTPVPTPGANQFKTQVPLVNGANTVAIQASAADGAVTTNRYQINNPQAMTFDANGNLTSDGSRNFFWDSENRLVQVTDNKTSPATVTTMEYDGLWRRTRIKSTAGAGGPVLSDKRYVWNSINIVEERSSDGAVTKRFYSRGVLDKGIPLFYEQDHLGSVWGLGDGGSIQRAAYSFDLWGRRSKMAGDLNADRGFTGHLFDTEIGMVLPLFRAYEPNLGRWLSRDPKGERGGLNLYGYVRNNPSRWIDALGLDVGDPDSTKPGGTGGYGGYDQYGNRIPGAGETVYDPGMDRQPGESDLGYWLRCLLGARMSPSGGDCGGEGQGSCQGRGGNANTGGY